MNVTQDHSRLPLFILVGLGAAFTLGLYDWIYNFARFWDFNVYIRAKAHMAETGSPYFERESLRYIYPPSANFFLHFIHNSQGFKSLYFILTGTVWALTATLFCRKLTDAFLVLPIFMIAFGWNGWITILSGNIATFMYFTAALAGWLYITNRIPIIAFALVILILMLIKPFYMEFLIFIWFMRDLKTFIAYAAGLLAVFFAVNYGIYHEQFLIFLETLKISDYDNEIFGITLLSHLIGLGVPSTFAFIAQVILLSVLFLIFIIKLHAFSPYQHFAILFILATFINPKQISYDLIVCLPALILLLLTAKRWVFIIGLAIVAIASLVDFNLAAKPWFQWWYAFVLCFVLTLLSYPNDKITLTTLWRRLLTPSFRITDK